MSIFSGDEQDGDDVTSGPWSEELDPGDALDDDDDDDPVDPETIERARRVFAFLRDRNPAAWDAVAVARFGPDRARELRDRLSRTHALRGPEAP